MGQLVDLGLTAARLIGNGLRYRGLHLAGLPGRPQAVTLELTNRCVCRCVMCNIWRVPGDAPELSLADWRVILRSDLLKDVREIDITGGEPFLLDDLVSLVDDICGLAADHLVRLRSIAITTNGVLAERVVEMVSHMLEPATRSDVELVIVCAVDAVGQDHDRIRRYKGAWANVDRCVTGLIELREKHPSLLIGLKTTVLAQNISHLEEIAEYARARGLFTIISPAIFTSGRYLNADMEDHLALTSTDRDRLADFYEGSAFRWSYHAAALARYLRTGEMKKPCTCGFNYFFVRSSGQVHLCPLHELSVGNVLDKPIDRLFASQAARNQRRSIGKMPSCRSCTEPGIERYSLPYEGFSYLRMLLRRGPRPFLELHEHLGLDKYV